MFKPTEDELEELWYHMMARRNSYTDELIELWYYEYRKYKGYQRHSSPLIYSKLFWYWKWYFDNQELDIQSKEEVLMINRLFLREK